MISDIPELTCFSLCRNWDSLKGECPILKTDSPKDFKNPRVCLAFTPFLDGDQIKRVCGAVGHGCEDCYIKCDFNPRDDEDADIW